MLGDGGVVNAGGEEHGQLACGALGHVDLVQANAVFADDLQAGQGLVEHGLGDLVIAAEEGVKVACELQHSAFRQRTALAMNVKALAFQQSMVVAGGVLIRGGGEQDAHGKKGWRRKDEG